MENYNIKIFVNKDIRKAKCEKIKTKLLEKEKKKQCNYVALRRWEDNNNVFTWKQTTFSRFFCKKKKKKKNT